jgi:chromosome segregation ATPase
MGEETTKNFDGEESFQARVLAELAALSSGMAVTEERFGALQNQLATGFGQLQTRLTSVEGRVASLELKVEALDEKVDARLRDTRPIWESVLSRLHVIDKKFDIHAHDMLELQAKVKLLEERVFPDA